MRRSQSLRIAEKLKWKKKTYKGNTFPAAIIGNGFAIELYSHTAHITKRGRIIFSYFFKAELNEDGLPSDNEEIARLILDIDKSIGKTLTRLRKKVRESEHDYFRFDVLSDDLTQQYYVIAKEVPKRVSCLKEDELP
jgi:hypothetical protein